MEWNAFQFLHRKPSGIDRVDTVVSGPRRAFTLAEVLITLAIIGIVAALTIPTVVKNYRATQLESQLKKVFSELNSVRNSLIVDEGCIMCKFNAYNTIEMRNLFMSKYKSAKLCNTADCPQNASYYTNYAGTAKLGTDKMTNPSMFQTASGALISTQYTQLNKLAIFVDINGYKKGPNRVGYDLFEFEMLKNSNDRIRPWGYDSRYAESGFEKTFQAVKNPNYFKNLPNL